jgi:uncharacterized protein YndB with AHSA1/START domain
MIRTLIRLGFLGTALAWLADAALRRSVGDGPPPPVSSLVVIDAPIDRVWWELADIEGQTRWMTEMTSVRLLDPPPVRVGTRGEATVRIAGITVTDPVTVMAFEPPTRFEVRHEGAFTGTGTITLERGADGSTTIARWDETLVAPFLPHLWAVLASPVLGAIFQADLERFRALCET